MGNGKKEGLDEGGFWNGILLKAQKEELIDMISPHGSEVLLKALIKLKETRLKKRAFLFVSPALSLSREILPSSRGHFIRQIGWSPLNDRLVE
ncbi:hypothetical protein IT6_03400 [Methylacidiphilum caldifontis]|uniref:hypothetical protein n=1 Tax=Methylacidiphilum caldifontis TaxID=2795386 RepID=UPI001A8C6A40|nr:hypothetical protein [Methylacidiphilum caldifontis]QSR89338.1 hypothetical protein IT6_03400 [Methylacidiphilum caldifontis]